MSIKDTYVMRGGVLVRKHRAISLPMKGGGNRVYVISDTMPPTKHMGTGKIHDSKAAFRADTRAVGCVEVGNDPAARRDNPAKRAEVPTSDIVQDVKRSIAELNR